MWEGSQGRLDEWHDQASNNDVDTWGCNVCDLKWRWNIEADVT